MSDKKLQDYVRTIPNYPKEGIMFRDITTLLSDPVGFKKTIDSFVEQMKDKGITHVVGIEARGFILGGAIAHQIGAGFVPLRKKGKLPYKTISQEYELEYGTDTLEIHIDALTAGDKVAIVDDLIATGGTAEAGIRLVNQTGATIEGAYFIVDLPDLNGADKIRNLNVPVTALMMFGGH